MRYKRTESLITACVDFTVHFNDLDPLEIVWHGNYVKYFEIARSRLMQSIDYDYPQMRESGYSWPVVECYLKYVRSATLNQVLTVEAGLLEYEQRLKVAYTIFDKVSRQKLTEGFTVQVAVDRASGEMQFASPSILCERITQYQTNKLTN